MDPRKLGVENTAAAPPVAVSVGAAGGSIVVVGNPRPLGPTLMVFPSMTVVVGVASGPIVSVVPEMIASDGPMEKVRSAAVTGVMVGFGSESGSESESESGPEFDPAMGMGTVILGPTTSDSLMVKTCPFATMVVSFGAVGMSVMT